LITVDRVNPFGRVAAGEGFNLAQLPANDRLRHVEGLTTRA
jgi:hypothetical protein